jgi:hypothetical protein
MTRYPLAWPDGWKRTAQGVQRAGRFTKYGRDLTVHEAIGRVLLELQRLGVREGDAIISTNLATRLDGLPRSDQRAPADPGVAVYWVRPGEAMKVMAIDRYTCVADNLAAVAATLGAMRAIERHGGAQILERSFRGFEALPAPEDWRVVLGLHPHAPVTLDDVHAGYLRARSKAHPDKGGGHDAFMAVQRAYDRACKELSK